MVKKIRNKYALENLPLSDKTREGLSTGVLIDALSALGTMMTLQDDVYEDVFKDIKEGLLTLKVGQESGFDEIKTRLASIELRLDSIELDQKRLHAKDKDLESQIKSLEGKINDLIGQFVELKKEFEEHKSE